MLLFQNKILEMIATGVSLDVTVERLCLELELLLPGVACSVLRVEDNGTLYPLAAPSLPEKLSKEIDGLMIGPNVGSCGSAAYLGEAVVVTDIDNDPRWAAFREHVLPHGFKACWSVPIFNAEGVVFGTFALYFKQRRMPRAREKQLVSASIHLCAIALEGHYRVLERERRASIDALTQLPNRSGFDAALSRLSCEKPGSWALLVVDVDNLKMINDTFGHQAGDELLQRVAERIRTSVLPDHAFRLGGDEFAVILQEAGAVADLSGTASHILDAVGVVTSCSGHMIQPRATIGGAALSPGDQDAETVHRHADFALYHAKETGRGGFVRYWPGIGTAIKRRIEVIQDVDVALDEGRIEAYYQPVVRIDTGEIVGMEALCRLRRPGGNIVSAGSFHQATTDVDVAAKLTEGMLALVAADVRTWLECGIPFQHVGINISSADFHSGTLYERIKTAFGRENVPLKHVVLEVTESVYLGQNEPVVAQEIKALRAHGLRIALDDFGTGFASLTHLLTVPVDIIKIDRSFVSQLRVADRGMAIIEGLLNIARKLDIKVIAEGIETEGQAELLQEIGCALGQGYLYSAAVPRESATALLLEHAQQIAGAKPAPIFGMPKRTVAGQDGADHSLKVKKGLRAVS
ncbi:sensor domain-containing phosphodiesterase [Sphingorhabdus sp. 109]|uniref:sensor domain-containing phosphodiesterase n=1 Tax=Sphingorhabdus sp. 109 TaxID=2653173 RepID=UPI0012EF43C5|nr:EAL domain-containing protein [Sphingorhabdus sp. 109]VWX56348.1 Diguanylate cyclase [Sphingorhabdus sp. 109]